MEFISSNHAPLEPHTLACRALCVYPKRKSHINLICPNRAGYCLLPQLIEWPREYRHIYIYVHIYIYIYVYLYVYTYKNIQICTFTYIDLIQRHHKLDLSFHTKKKKKVYMNLIWWAATSPPTS